MKGWLCLREVVVSGRVLLFGRIPVCYLVV